MPPGLIAHCQFERTSSHDVRTDARPFGRSYGETSDAVSPETSDIGYVHDIYERGFLLVRM